jgi:hypothetical protein
MTTQDFLQRCHGDVRIQLTDGSCRTGHFRTDILSPEAVSAYFHGDERDISLPIDLIASIESLAPVATA